MRVGGEDILGFYGSGVRGFEGARSGVQRFEGGWFYRFCRSHRFNHPRTSEPLEPAPIEPIEPPNPSNPIISATLFTRVLLPHPGLRQHLDENAADHRAGLEPALLAVIGPVPIRHRDAAWRLVQEVVDRIDE